MDNSTPDTARQLVEFSETGIICPPTTHFHEEKWLLTALGVKSIICELVSLTTATCVVSIACLRRCLSDPLLR